MAKNAVMVTRDGRFYRAMDQIGRWPARVSLHIDVGSRGLGCMTGSLLKQVMLLVSSTFGLASTALAAALIVLTGRRQIDQSHTLTLDLWTVCIGGSCLAVTTVLLAVYVRNLVACYQQKAQW